MKKISSFLTAFVKRFWNNEKGFPLSVEMTLIVVAVALVAGIAAYGLGTQVGAQVTSSGTSLTSNYTAATQKVGTITP